VRALVTGAAGFIGSHLSEYLLDRGHSVVGMDNLITGDVANIQHLTGRDFVFVKHDVTNYIALEGPLDLIFHFASPASPIDYLRVPIQTLKVGSLGTHNALGLAKAKNARFLLASTSEVYGKSEKPVFSEDDDLLIGPPTKSRWGYACSKLMDEFLALAYAQEKALPVTIARLFNTVGPRQTGRYGMVLPRFIGAAKRGEPLFVHGDGLQSRCFCFVQDTVEALVRLQNTPASRGEVFNIGSTEEITILDLAKLVIAALDSKSRIELLPYDRAYAPGFEDMRRRKPSVTKLLATTGFQPATTLRQTIQKTAEALP